MRRFAASRTFCEFFAGIGLVHAGLRGTGWECTYANDIEPKKHEMYRALFPAADYFHCEDLWNTDAVLDRIRDFPLLATASFPCTDLSTAGYYRGLSGAESSAFFALVKVMDGLRTGGRLPPMLLVENVPGLLTSRSGRDFATLAASLANLGYWLDAIMVDAKHFVPQSRSRLFIVGAQREFIPDSAIRQGATAFMEPSWEDRLAGRHDLRPRRLREAMTKIKLSTGWVAHDLPRLGPRTIELDEVIGTADDENWWDEAAVEKHLAMMSDRHKSLLRSVRSVEARRIGMIYRRRRSGQMRAEVRFDGLAGCLRTPKGGSARQIVVVVHGANNVRMRWMSPVEYARLQGIGDFPVAVPPTQAIFGFADGVCVPAIQWIDRNLLSPLAERVAVHG